MLLFRLIIFVKLCYMISCGSKFTDRSTNTSSLTNSVVPIDFQAELIDGHRKIAEDRGLSFSTDENFVGVKLTEETAEEIRGYYKTISLPYKMYSIYRDGSENVINFNVGHTGECRRAEEIISDSQVNNSINLLASFDIWRSQYLDSFGYRFSGFLNQTWRCIQVDTNLCANPDFHFPTEISQYSLGNMQLLDPCDPTVLPVDPTNLSLSSNFGASVTASWEEATGEGVPETDHFIVAVERNVEPNPFCDSPNVFTTTETSITVPATTGFHYVRVCAVGGTPSLSISQGIVGSIGVIQRETPLLASDGEADNFFGGAVAISGERAVVGAYFNDENGTYSGAAYVYKQNGVNWNEEVKLMASDGRPGDYLGSAVAIDGDVIVVGAPGLDYIGQQNGAAYVFRYNGSQWLEEEKLLASDSAKDNLFGNSVAVSGNRILVGAERHDGNGVSAGAAYMFEFDGQRWNETTKLVASLGSYTGYFGNSVAIEGDRAVIGSRGDDEFGRDAGAAYVFSFNGNEWIESTKLTANDAANGDGFGYDVSVSGDHIFVGSVAADDKGAVYAYRFDGTSWIESKLVASDGASADHFGITVSISGNRAVIGADNKSSGTAYVFRLDGDMWVEEKTIWPGDAGAERFGRSVSISGDQVVVGADRSSDLGYHSGKAYIYK